MNIGDIERIGGAIIGLLRGYHNPPKKELLLDVILLAYLSGRGSQVSRQHYIRVMGSQRPKRIDFRIGGNNPVVLELAVRSKNNSATLYGSQNLSELRKLCRVSKTQARLRALLLLDLADRPILRNSLKASYDPLNAGRGKFKRTSVRVVYVHAQSRYNFLWDPFRS